MTTRTAAEGNDGAVPVACTLTSADLAAQSERWERLAARATAERAETADGLRICFRPEPGAEDELRRLAAVETRCCPWADWLVEATAGRLVLTVRSTGEGVAVLHRMFTAGSPADMGLEPTAPCSSRSTAEPSRPACGPAGSDLSPLDGVSARWRARVPVRLDRRLRAVPPA